MVEGGGLKNRDLFFLPATLDAIGSLKLLCDPDVGLNLGKLLPMDRGCLEIRRRVPFGCAEDQAFLRALHVECQEFLSKSGSRKTQTSFEQPAGAVNRAICSRSRWEASRVILTCTKGRPSLWPKAISQKTNGTPSPFLRLP